MTQKLIISDYKLKSLMIQSYMYGLSNLDTQEILNKIREDIKEIKKRMFKHNKNLCPYCGNS